MSFTRTNSGLSNLALFYNVDLIVFTEGGDRSYRYDEVIEGSFNNKSVDIKFWSGIFKKFEFKKKVEFRGLGSKTCSKKICELICENKIRNIAVARDSDLDNTLGQIYDSPHVLYTNGYSWENDVWAPHLVKAQVESFVLMPSMPADISIEIDKYYDEFYRQSKRLMRTEIVFRQSGVKLVTDLTGEQFIRSSPTPSLNISQIRTLISSKKTFLRDRPCFIPDAVRHAVLPKYIYGKLVEAFGMAIIRFVCKKVGGVKIFPREILVASMIERFALSKSQDAESFYLSALKRLEEAH